MHFSEFYYCQYNKLQACNRSRTSTCLTTATAVVPLQMQSISECCLSSSSTCSNVLTNMFFHVDNRCFSSLVSSLDVVESDLSEESKSVLLEGSCSVASFKVSVEGSSCSSVLGFKAEDSFMGRVSRTWRATSRPRGPCPSNTPQKMWPLWPAKS